MASNASYDVVIRNGLVVDGSGLGSYKADVGIIGATIACIGRIRERGTEEIDAEGLAVTPGFIDGHTHMDAQIFWDPLGTNSCWHGITSVVMGNCGFTLAPAKPDRRDLVVRNLERAEDISPAALAAGVRWSWESFREYLDAVDSTPKAINYAGSIGHSALRTWAMGEAAFERAATDDELKRMQGEVRDAIEAGAIGFTTSRSPNHETSDDRPVASRIAPWDEVRSLVGVLGDVGAGFFQLANESAGRGDDLVEREAYFDRLRALAAETLVPIVFGVTATRNGFHELGLIDDIAQAAGRAFGLSRCRDISLVHSFRSNLPFDTIEEWKPVRALPLAEQKAALRNPAIRARLLQAVREGRYGRSINPRPAYERVFYMERPYGANPSVAELARERGVEPAEAMIDIALETDFAALFVQPAEYQEPEKLLKVLRHPRTLMTFSDSGAHVSQISDCSIQTHFLAEFVRERQLFTLEEAIRMLTLEPALAFGIRDRGLLREGMVADLNVMNPATVGPELPEVVHDLPGGAKRLLQKAAGFRATVVGGQVTFREGRHTGALPGRLLRGPLAS